MKYVSREKSKQLAEQAAAIVGLVVLGEEDGRKPGATSLNDDVISAWREQTGCHDSVGTPGRNSDKPSGVGENCRLHSGGNEACLVNRKTSEPGLCQKNGGTCNGNDANSGQDCLNSKESNSGISESTTSELTVVANR